MRSRRWLSVVIVVLMVLTTVDITAFAQSVENTLQISSEVGEDVMTEEATNVKTSSNEEVTVLQSSVLSNPRIENGVTTWDCVWFGQYWQNDTNGDGTADVSDEKEPIKWRVLNVENDVAMLISDQIITYRSWNGYTADSTWDTSGIRRWLNSYSDNDGTMTNSGFLYESFSDYEKTLITVKRDDQVTLLELDDVSNANYGFIDDNARKAVHTNFAAYVKSQDSRWSNLINKWWLNSRVGTYDCRYVQDTGTVYNGSGYGVDHIFGIRPVLFLDVSQGGYLYAGTVTSTDIVDESKGESEKIELDKTLDEYIISEVQKYCVSPQYFTLFHRIIDSDFSRDEKLRSLNMLFNCYGITDIGEGIQFTSDATAYQRDFLYLTTNDCYCSYNFSAWLHSSDANAIAARSALYSSSLIYNYELWDYMDISTYVTGDYPGVEKCKSVLLKIMEFDSENIVNSSVDNSKQILNACENLIKLNGVLDDTLMEDFKKAKTDEEARKAMEAMVEKIIADGGVVGENTVYIAADGIAEAMDYSAPVIEFVGVTAETVVDFIYLEQDIQRYKKYSNFLNTVATNPDVSADLRLAANQILDEMNNGYFALIDDVMCEYFDILYDVTDDLVYGDEGGIVKAILKESGTELVKPDVIPLGDALTTIKLAAYISNMFVDMGSFVKEVAYTQAYAELGVLYSIKLNEDRSLFIENPTAENAWKFFEDYTMLWHIRYLGEQQYVKMQEVDFGNILTFDPITKIKSSGYSFKKEVADSICENLDQCRFTIASQYEIPASVQYIKKAVIHCPVDVYVYAEDGTCIAVLKDGVESDVTNEYGRFVVVYDQFTGEYIKVICQSTDAKLTTKLQAVDTGMVDYESNDGTIISSFDKVVVEKDDVVEINDDQYKVVNAEGVVQETAKLTENNINEYVPIESVQLDTSELIMQCGDTKLVSVKAVPENATNRTVEWYSLDTSVATVDNGVITAQKAGATTIYVKVADADSLIYEIPVTVKETYSITVTAGDNGKITPTESVSVKEGESKTFTITADSGYHIKDVKVNGTSVGAVTSYTFSNIKSNCTIEAIFEKDANTYTVKYNANSSTATGSMKSQVITYGSGTKLTANSFVNKGFTFAGWNTKADGTGTAYADKVDGSKIINESGKTVTLYAQWVLNKPYKIVNVVSGIHVYWTAVEGVSKYGLWRSENGINGTYKWIANPTVAHFTDTKVESGKTYYYKVTVLNTDTNVHSAKSEAIGNTYVGTPDITFRANSAYGVRLGWNKISGATGYAIYRKPYDGDTWVRVTTIKGNSTFTWTDSSVKTNNGTVYKYTIRALAGSDMKTLSGCRSTGRTMARLTSRTLNSAVKTSATSIKCNWTTTTICDGYEVRFMVGSNVYKTFTVGNYKTGAKTFTGLKAGQTYKVQVRSYKKVEGVGTFYSAWSTEKMVQL